MQRQVAESSEKASSIRNGPINPFEAQRAAGIGDRRYLGKYDARFHSTNRYQSPFLIPLRMDTAQPFGEGLKNLARSISDILSKGSVLDLPLSVFHKKQWQL